MNETSDFKPTPLRDYYVELRDLNQKEETEKAETAVEVPGSIAKKFAESVELVSKYPAIDMEFHPGTRKPLADPPVPVPKIRRTAEFASQLARGGSPRSCGPRGLKFKYVEREIFPLRTTLKGGPRPGRRWMDLLLVSSDGLPIVSELKIRQDRLSYFALIQSLMYAAELSSESQQMRLQKQYPKAKFTIPKKGPALDIFIIAFDPPKKGRYRDRSFQATKRLSEKLINDNRVGKVIRRIAYLSAAPEGNELDFEERFSFQGL